MGRIVIPMKSWPMRCKCSVAGEAVVLTQPIAVTVRLRMPPKNRHRHLQLRRLYDLIQETRKPVVVAGDYNTFWGENEIYLFMKAAGLQSANVDSQPTYPSRAPRKELDFILYQDGIEVTNFEVPLVKYSDHLPLVCDFEVA